MRLTNELFAPFIGGQVKIQNSYRNHVLWGKVKSVDVGYLGSELVITFAWLARGIGLLYETKEWSRIPNQRYQASGRMLFWLEVNGSPDIRGCQRIVFFNKEKDDLVAFYMPRGEKIECPSAQSFEVVSI